MHRVSLGLYKNTIACFLHVFGLSLIVMQCQMPSRFSFRSYDLYTTREPGVFEAMALVHSRIRRVVFGIPNEKDGGLGGTGMEDASSGSADQSSLSSLLLRIKFRII